MTDLERLKQRIIELTGWRYIDTPSIVVDTSDWMRIVRGDIIRLDGRDFVVRGNKHETRFGIGGQPKYWVFSAYDFETGEQKIIKTVFHEDFFAHIGIFKIHCYRSPEKEGEVLELVKGDRRFMQGYTTYDEKGNNVRVIDFIPGQTFFNYIHSISKSHEQYFHEDLPRILYNLVAAIDAISFLHEHKYCHGDIRNDHIIIEPETGQYRWIDFDLKQNVSDFDTWSIGNILNYAVGKGITSFQQVMRSKEFTDEAKNSLVPEDGSAFYEYRIMNLQKLYPYIPDSLSAILNHFTIRPRKVYYTLSDLMDDYYRMLDQDFPLR
ncbi:MAG: protein kinase [candidate division Zixibacteria bacterium]|nr:protein kinase [candidate division Zixibacteria bacterium]